MKKFIVLFLFVCFILYSSFVFAMDKSYDLVTYCVKTGGTITVAWDVVTNASFYQVKMLMVEKNVTTSVVTTPSLSIILTPAKTGHYIVQARSVQDLGGGNYNYSEWATSNNPAYATVNGVARGWWFYAYLEGPGGIVVSGNLNIR